MDVYYVNKLAQATGEHEVHKDPCWYLPIPEHRLKLGLFHNCHEAVAEAKKYYTNVDGCYYCCINCHKK